QDRLVVECRPVVGHGDDLAHVFYVTTRWTPGTFFAALVSIDRMRPCATVLRKILACSMPGSRMVWVYSARPVTLSRASSRGSERPTCAPTRASCMVFVAINGSLRCRRAPLGPRARHRRA